jgi:hypothetical protein
VVPAPAALDICPDLQGPAPFHPPPRPSPRPPACLTPAHPPLHSPHPAAPPVPWHQPHPPRHDIQLTSKGGAPSPCLASRPGSGCVSQPLRLPPPAQP